MKNYNEIVSALREIARDQLRMESISSHRNAILDINNSIASTEKDNLERKRQIAILEYQTSKVEDANPEKEELLKSHNERIQYNKDNIALAEKEIAGLKENVRKEEEEIAKWENGENKVNADRMEEIALDLVKLVTNEAARNLAIEKPEEKKGKKAQ